MTEKLCWQHGQMQAILTTVSTPGLSESEMENIIQQIE